MVPPPPSKSSRTSSEINDDLISNLPMVVIDKIFQHLPLSECARMSVLSKKWRNNWSSISSLYFNEEFWIWWMDEDDYLDWQLFSSIISNIFILHQGPIHEVILDIPEFNVTIEYEEITAFLSRLLCFLSRNGVKRIILNPLVSLGNKLCVPSNLFLCTELEELVLSLMTVNHPPVEFKGFSHLKKLHLKHMDFKHDILASLIASCPKLATLMVQDCSGVNHLIIDAPMLENCILIGQIGSIAFNKSPKYLVELELSLSRRNSLPCVDVAITIKDVERSCELESLTLGRHSIQLMAAATDGLRKSRLLLAFSHLKKLSLLDLNLINHDVLLCTFGLLQSCPSLIKLEISVMMSRANLDEYLVDFSPEYTFLHLRFVTVKIVRCCKTVLKLIEFLLACSPILEKLTILPIKELKRSSYATMLVQLNRFRRISPKVEVICPVLTVASSSPSSSEDSSSD